MTYIPKQTKLTRDRLEAKLETGLIEKLERYCKYLESDRDYVVGQALEIAFKRDKAFTEWLKSREADQPAEIPTAVEWPQERKVVKRGSANSADGTGNSGGQAAASELGAGVTPRCKP